ncbi:MAG: ABC transporter permease [Chloroflexota bacterium]|nr:ABC transporter permease [Chloroflexota bacterium]
MGHNVTRALAFIRRDFQTQVSYRLAFFMRIVGMLISVSIFYFISQILDTAASPYLQRYGSDYFHFALLGIAFYPFINLSANSPANAIHEYQHTGTLEVLFLSPTPFLASVVMSTLWSYCWTFAESLFYLLVAGLFFQAHLDWANIFSAVLVVLLTILANAGLGFINASFVLVTKRTSPLARLLGLVTNLLAGVYYPTEVLPNWLRAFSQLLPATYSLDALRRTMLQSASLADVGQDLLALAGFIVVLLPIGLVAFRFAVRWAKIDGSLSQF